MTALYRVTGVGKDRSVQFEMDVQAVNPDVAKLMAVAVMRRNPDDYQTLLKCEEVYAHPQVNR
jgi:hypothetical protein